MSADDSDSGSTMKFAPPQVDMKEREGGEIILRSRLPLSGYERHAGNYLRKQAGNHPERCFLAERKDKSWRKMTYAEVLKRAESIGQALLNRGLSQDRPLMILSGNSINHALLTLGGFLAGVPVVPVSPAYSLMSDNLSKLEHVSKLVSPGLVYAESAKQFERALNLASKHDVHIVLGDDDSSEGRKCEHIDALASEVVDNSLAQAEDRINPDTPAKYLFTSGSTGSPKGVITTHRMLCSNQSMLDVVWPTLKGSELVLVDWLPWHHTFGGSFVFNLAMSKGGTLYIDEGKPAPDLIEKTVANLRTISPTLYFNVPAGYAQLISFLEEDEALRNRFFKKLDVIFYAAAALPQDLWERLQTLAERTKDSPVTMISGWGTTETAPMSTIVHFAIKTASNIGVPAPGVTIKLTPQGDKTELRVKGPNITPGYLGSEQLTREAFDEEGYYRTGDAGELVDPDNPAKGLVFKGRLAEDFKLDTGTWVHAGKLRVDALSATSPVLQDAVITGHDRSFIGLLAWPNIEGCRKIAGLNEESTTAEELLKNEKVVNHLTNGLKEHNRNNPGSSARIRRVLLMTDPPEIDADEITDKGYINQRATLENRSKLVRQLYAAKPTKDVIIIE